MAKADLTLPIAARGTPWSKTEARDGVRKLLNSTLAPSAEYGKAFFYTHGDGKDFGDYHLPFSAVVDGKLTAIPRAIFAAAAAVQGSRGGIKLPAEATAAKPEIEHYYERMAKQFDDDSIVAPWNKKDEADEDKDEHSVEPLSFRDFSLELDNRALPNPEGDDRRVTLSFSSEKPINGLYSNEVLSHEPGAVDLSRMNGAPLLLDHNPRNQIGVVERAEIGADRKGRAVVRFGKNPDADAIFNDVKDKIRRNVSVGYNHDAPESVMQDGTRLNVIKHWMPMELSIVGIPADPSVGVGRSAVPDSQKSSFDSSKRINTQETEQIRSTITQSEPKMPTETPETLKSERERVQAINTMADKLATQNPDIKDIGRRAVEAGTSEREFLLEAFKALETKGLVTRTGSAEIGLSAREAHNFSFTKAIRAMLPDASRADREAATFELEASDAARKLSTQIRGSFTVPYDVMRVHGQRAALSATGSDIVATHLLAQDFVEYLYNNTVIRKLGGFPLDGLVGNVTIPTESATATSYVLSTDTSAITESEPTFGEISLSPSNVTALSKYSKQLLMQSTPNVEMLVRQDLASVLAVELDALGISGTGASGQPTGILNTAGIGVVALGTNGAAPTYTAVVDLMGALMKANAYHGKLGFAINGQGFETLATTARIGSTYPVFIINDPYQQLLGHPIEVSQNIPSTLTKGTGTGLSAMIFANWSDVICASWGGLDILVDPYTYSASAQVGIVAYAAVAFALRHAGSVAVINDMITS